MSEVDVPSDHECFFFPSRCEESDVVDGLELEPKYNSVAVWDMPNHQRNSHLFFAYVTIFNTVMMALKVLRWKPLTRTTTYS